MVAADDVRRQATAVVPVEETPLLVAVQRVVGAVEVQEDPLRRRGTGFEEQVDHKFVHRLRVGLLVPVGLAGHAQLKPVQGSGQRVAALANPILSGQVVARQRQQTVVPKLVVVVEILVPQHEAGQPLGDQPPHRALDALLAPVVSASRRVRPGARSASRNSGTPP